MPVYNNEEYVHEAIESILTQTFTDFEFLIINDGSTDASRTVIASYHDPRIRLIDNPINMGLIKSLNRGLSLARGEYVARIDGDDTSYPERLEKQVRFLDAHTEVAMVGTQRWTTNQHGKRLFIQRKPTTWISIRWELMFDNPFAHSSVMFQRVVVWEKLGGYDERSLHVEDFELWSRIARGYELCNLSEIMGNYRVHPGNVSGLHPGAKRPKPLPPGLVEEGIYRGNLRTFLKLPHVSEAWPRLMNSLRLLPLVVEEIEDPEQLIVAIEMAFTRFCSLHPEAARDQEVRQHCANQLWRVAYCFARRNRWVSLVAWMRACQVDPAIMRRDEGMKYLALITGGERVRAAYQRWISLRKYD
jgi:glycosyltransferase involved in cell wall biosynthesis